MEEIEGCIKHIGLSWGELQDMPVFMRKNLIEVHNRTNQPQVEEDVMTALSNIDKQLKQTRSTEHT